MKNLLLLAALFAFTTASAQNDIPLPKQEQEEIEKKNFYEQSETKLQLRNNTGKEIYVSYVNYDKSESSWTSHGWYKLEAYKTKVLPLGNYIGPVYIHGETQGLLSNYSWGDKWMFCIDPSSAFEILNADKIDCPKKAKFYKTNVEKGINKWTFNP